MQENSPFDRKSLTMMKTIASEGMNNAAQGFSGMVGRKIEVSDPVFSVVPFLTIPEIIGRSEDDAVGIYLRFEGDLFGQIMMIIPYPRALELADLILGSTPGTTQQLGSLERSALGELGNLCTSFFLNAVATTTGTHFRPTPPAVIVDMLGAILDILIATIGSVSENVLVVHANLVDGTRSVGTDFWIVPDMKTLQMLMQKNSST